MASAAILRETRRGPGGGWAVISKDGSEMETFLSPGRGNTTDLASAHLLLPRLMAPYATAE